MPFLKKRYAHDVIFWILRRFVRNGQQVSRSRIDKNFLYYQSTRKLLAEEFPANESDASCCPRCKEYDKSRARRSTSWCRDVVRVLIHDLWLWYVCPSIRIPCLSRRLRRSRNNGLKLAEVITFIEVKLIAVIALFTDRNEAIAAVRK